MKPLISPKLAAIAAVIVPLLLAIAPALPEVGGVRLDSVAGILAYVAAALAGLALPSVGFAAGNPVVPKVAVPVLAGSVPLLAQLSDSTTGILGVLMHGLALVVAFLAGLAAPVPQTPAEPEVKA